MSRTRVPPPPPLLPSISVLLMPAGRELHRLHAGSFRPAEFNPCKGQPSRFAPFTSMSKGLCVPTLYAANTREAAAFETIFHDIQAGARFKSVPLSAVASRIASVLRLKRDLSLASLFTPDLMAWNLRRDQLIDTPKSTYRSTALWARAIHHTPPPLDGLVWTSRRCDPELCILAFGDRLQETDFEVIDSRAVATDAALLLELREYGRRAGIVIVT